MTGSCSLPQRLATLFLWFISNIDMSKEPGVCSTPEISRKQFFTTKMVKLTYNPNAPLLRFCTFSANQPNPAYFCSLSDYTCSGNFVFDCSKHFVQMASSECRFHTFSIGHCVRLGLSIYNIFFLLIAFKSIAPTSEYLKAVIFAVSRVLYIQTDDSHIDNHIHILITDQDPPAQ